MADTMAILNFWFEQLKLFFNLHVTLMLLPSFKSIGLSVQEKKRKIDFHSGQLGFPIRTILAFLDPQVTPMLPTEFQVNMPFS